MSPVSDEAMEIQPTLPSERTVNPMDTAPAQKTHQSIPMFDDPISSASEDENRTSRVTVKSKVVAVPLHNSMRLPDKPTLVASTSRVMSGSAPSTSRAGLIPIGAPDNTRNGSDNLQRTANPRTYSLSYI